MTPTSSSPPTTATCWASTGSPSPRWSRTRNPSASPRNYRPRVPQGLTRDELVANNDLAPTMAGWAGVDTPSVDGRSLVPLLSDEAVSWRNALLTENPGGMTGRYGRVPGHAALVTRSFVYIEWR